ncbi:hypothetical protein AUJ69_04465 [Candidatus Woesearchaeota archaeon CG1_02_47_18]|nr:MAG: hypothetical protein AUJ69_04465 [Candidatus Woesearchaeota archaeon CG1_02_47_18]
MAHPENLENILEAHPLYDRTVCEEIGGRLLDGLCAIGHIFSTVKSGIEGATESMKKKVQNYRKACEAAAIIRNSSKEYSKNRGDIFLDRRTFPRLAGTFGLAAALGIISLFDSGCEQTSKTPVAEVSNIEFYCNGESKPFVKPGSGSLPPEAYPVGVNPTIKLELRGDLENAVSYDVTVTKSGETISSAQDLPKIDFKDEIEEPGTYTITITAYNKDTEPTTVQGGFKAIFPKATGTIEGYDQTTYKKVPLENAQLHILEDGKVVRVVKANNRGELEFLISSGNYDVEVDGGDGEYTLEDEINVGRGGGDLKIPPTPRVEKQKILYYNKARNEFAEFDTGLDEYVAFLRQGRSCDEMFNVYHNFIMSFKDKALSAEALKYLKYFIGAGLLSINNVITTGDELPPDYLLFYVITYENLSNAGTNNVATFLGVGQSDLIKLGKDDDTLSGALGLAPPKSERYYDNVNKRVVVVLGKNTKDIVHEYMAAITGTVDEEPDFSAFRMYREGGWIPITGMTGASGYTELGYNHPLERSGLSYQHRLGVDGYTGDWRLKDPESAQDLRALNNSN